MFLNKSKEQRMKVWRATTMEDLSAAVAELQQRWEEQTCSLLSSVNEKKEDGECQRKSSKRKREEEEDITQTVTQTL